MARHVDYLAPEFVALAHRGGALLPQNLGIENTYAAFQAAVDLGYRYLETDVHASSDGVLFGFHDEDLGRVTDHPGRIADLTAGTLASVRVGGREPIPTLDALLESFPECRFNIDIKAGPAVDALASTLRRHNAAHRVCVGSFSQARIRRFRRLMPEVLTAASPAEVALLATGRVRPSSVPHPFQVPVTHRVGPRTVRILTPERVRRIHALGRKVHVWTIDSPERMYELIDWGVDGIVTDRPDLLKGVLTAKGMWSTRGGT